MRLKVYIASKFRHGKRWRDLGWDEVTFTSRWFLEYYGRVPDEPEYCKIGWMHDIEDAVRSDVVLIYGGNFDTSEGGDLLVGALVEAGAALAYGKQVIVVGAGSGAPVVDGA